MTAEEFRSALWAGRGSAMLHAREHDVSEFREIVLDAFLHCRAWDPQIEGTRASYMLDLVNSLPDAAFYREALVASLAGCGDDYDAVQRYWIASWMDGDARRAMYEHFSPGPRRGESIAVALVKMDGQDGFTFAIERLRKLAERDASRIDAGFLEDFVFDELGEDAWESSEHARRYRELISPHRAVAEKSRKVTDEELGEIVQQVASTENADERRRLIKVFAQKRFAGDPELLLRWARGDDERLALAACRALRLLPSATVRELAIEFVRERRPQRAEAVAMLSGCAEPGDHEMVCAWFAAETDVEVIHSMGLDLRVHWKDHPDRQVLVPVLEMIYERTPCAECRSYAVQDLMKLDALTEQRRRECAFDADEDIREWVAGTP